MSAGSAVRGAAGGVVARLWLGVLLISAWEMAATWAEESYFPPPSRFVAAAWRLWFSGPPDRLFLTDKAADDFAPSLGHLLGGWLLAGVVGVVVGLAVGLSRRLSDYAEPAFHFFRAIPPPALIPVFLAIFAGGATMQVATIVFGIIWPILINTIDGVRTIDPMHLDTARAFDIPPVRRLWRIIIPAASPKIAAGLRVSLSIALILMVLAELVGSTTGIGAHLVGAQRSFELPEMWAAIALLGILGYLLNTVFLSVERRLLAWHNQREAP